MPKSDIKNKFLFNQFPSCFTATDRHTYDVVIEDTIVSLRGRIFGAMKKGGAKHFTVHDMVKMCFEPCMREIKRGVSHYVHLFDKPSHVDSAKAPEQAKRDESASNETISIAKEALADVRHQMASDVGYERVSQTGVGWAAMITDRQCRQAVIRMICSAAVKCLPTMMEEWGVPATSRVWIEWDSPSVNEPWSVGRQGALRCREVSNALGEFDVSHLVYVHATRSGVLATGRPNPTILVKSIDTDILCINMLHHTGVIVETTLPKYKRTPVHIDVNGIVDGLLARWPERSMQDFCEVYLLSGSDFVIGGVQGIGQLRLFQEFYDQSSELPEYIAAVLKMARSRLSLSSRSCNARHRRKRARYALEYWLDAWEVAVSPATKKPRPTQPLGNGFATKGGLIVCAEDVCPICSISSLVAPRSNN